SRSCTASSYSPLAKWARPHSSAFEAMPNAAPTHASVPVGVTGAVGLAATGARIGARGIAGSSDGDGGRGRSTTVIGGFSIGASANGTSAARSGGGGGADLPELLPRQAEAGERAIAIGRFEVLQVADRLEGFRRVAEAAQLELGLTFQQERAGAEGFLIARRGRLGLRGRLGPFLLLERRLGQIVRRLVRQRVMREFLAEPSPGHLLVLDLAGLARDHAGVVERFGGRRRLHQLRVRSLLLGR